MKKYTMNPVVVYERIMNIPVGSEEFPGTHMLPLAIYSFLGYNIHNIKKARNAYVIQ